MEEILYKNTPLEEMEKDELIRVIGRLMSDIEEERQEHARQLNRMSQIHKARIEYLSRR